MKKTLGIGAVLWLLVWMPAATRAADPLTLLPNNADGKFLVPANGALSTNWIAPAFDDTGWSNVTGGIGFDVPRAPVAVGGVIGDSVAEFSGVQGGSNWYYGYWDKGSAQDAVYQSWDFIAFPREFGNITPGANNLWDGTKWTGGNPFTDELYADGGRPSRANDGSAHYVIRRWVSRVNGLVHLVGAISHDAVCGAGVDLRIWVDGVEMAGIANVTNAAFAANVEVQIGSTVDFAVGPATTNDSCDAFGFKVKLLQNTLADSAEDFAGVQGARGWTYGYYNKTADADGIYNPTNDFNNTDSNLTFNGAWNLGPGDPPRTVIGRKEMRPHSGPQQWAIRRYTSSHAGPVRIAGGLTIFQDCGGGTLARIFVDGIQVFSRGLSQTSVGYSVLANVSIGSRIDFALDPNGDGGCDGTTWTATIQPAAVSSMLVADSEMEFSGTQGRDNWYYGYYDRTADGDALYNPATDFNRNDPGWTFNGVWTLGPGDPPWDTLGRLDIHPNGINDGAEHWIIRRWASKVTGPITVDWHFSKSNPDGEGSTLIVLQNGQEMDAASVAGDDLVGISRGLALNVRQGDLIEFVQTPVGPMGDPGDGADGSLFNARIYAHAYNPGAICMRVADSQADWSASGQQGFRGWRYGYYNRTADRVPGYQAGDFTPFPRDGAGWSPTDFWDGGSWNWSPDPAPWDNIGRTAVQPNGTNTYVSEEHWVIRRWVSTVRGTVRVDWFTRKANPFGTGVSGKLFHNGAEKDSAATADAAGFKRSLTLPAVGLGDFIDLALTPVGPGSDGSDSADGSENGMTIYSCNNLIDSVATDVASRMQDVNSSAYLRQRFSVANPPDLGQVWLRIKYDDGFAAWLNGVEIARRNAPVALAWNSCATTSRTTAQAVAPEVIDVTSFKRALVPGVNVLAIQGLNRGIDDSDFLLAPEITAVNRLLVALDRGASTPMNTSITLSARQLLNNDSDPGAIPLILSSVPPLSAEGGSVLLSNGNVRYTPPAGFTGNDTFAYTVSDDRGGTATANVQVFVYTGVLPSQNQVLLLPVAGGQCVRFAGNPGMAYLVQRAPNLTPPITWTTLQTVTAPAHGIMECTDPSQLPVAFYRAIPAP